MPDDTTNTGGADDRARMEQKHKEWDTITAKRSEMLRAEKERQLKREQEEQGRQALEQQAFQEDVAATKERSADREEWRQEQHQKRLEDTKKKRELEEQKRLEIEKQKKLDAEQAERQQAMKKLHSQAVARKIKDKRANAENEEYKEIKEAGHSAERQQSGVDDELNRTLDHLEAERKRRVTQAHLEEEREQARLEKNAKLAGKKIATDMLLQRQLLALHEETEKKIANAEEEIKRLKNEARKHANDKKLLITREEDRRKRESTLRKENFEKWLKEG